MSAPNTVTLKKAPTFVWSNGKKAKPEVIAESLRSLSMILAVGGAEAGALEVVGHQYRRYNVGRAYTAAASAMINEGASFQQALLAQEIFPRSVREMIESAPRASMIYASLDESATIVQDSQTVKKKLRSALIQPTFMLVVTIIFLFIAALSIVPGIIKSFLVLGSDAPESATLVLQIANVVTWVLGILMSAAAGLVGYWFAFGRRNKRLRTHLDRLIIKSPLVGPIVQMSATGRLLQILATGLESGRNEPAALVSAGGGCGNEALYEHCVHHAARMHDDGARLRDFATTQLVPESTRFMLAAAPSVRQEITTMRALAPRYRAEANQRLESLTKMLEPLMNIFIYSAAGLLIIAVVFPMYSIFPALMDVGTPTPITIPTGAPAQ